jgi:hypothetical protein
MGFLFFFLVGKLLEILIGVMGIIDNYKTTIFEY